MLFSEFLQFIIRHYGHALEYGCKYLYQCMPRLLTLWLDFGSKVPDSGEWNIIIFNVYLCLQQAKEVKISLV